MTDVQNQIAGATAERARIKLIVGLEEAKGREAAALSFALNSNMSADEAKLVLASLPKATAIGATGGLGRSSDSPIGIALDGGYKKPDASGALSPDELAARINEGGGR